MNSNVKQFVLGAGAIVMMSAAIVPESPLKIGFLPDARAFLRVHPAATVAVVGTASASASKNAAATANAQASAANANAAAATANANAAAAEKKADTAVKTAAAAAGPAIGTTVTTLPPGCVAEKLNNVAYQRCGSTYYAASMMGTNLVFVVAQP